jgi:Tol biopolymer transport system component
MRNAARLAVAIGCALPVAGAAPAGWIACEVRHWKGEYATRDVAGRAAATPVTSELVLVRADGVERRRIALPEARAEWPVASPDGKWLYFQTETKGRWRIDRMRPDGSDRTTMAPAAALGAEWHSAYGVRLSREGGHAAYTASDGATGRAVVARADGSEARFVAPELGYTYMAAPDDGGKRVVFSGPARDYRLMLTDAGGVRELTPDMTECFGPQFADDGEAVVFTRREGGLYRVRCDGAGLLRLAGGVAVEFRLSEQDKHGSTDFPAIAPDGKSVAFVAGEARRGFTVCVVPIAGGERRVVAERSGACARLTWSPDGRWLAFVGMTEGRPQLFVVPGDGSAAPRQITTEAGAVYAVAWVR